MIGISFMSSVYSVVLINFFLFFVVVVCYLFLLGFRLCVCFLFGFFVVFFGFLIVMGDDLG